MVAIQNLDSVYEEDQKYRAKFATVIIVNCECATREQKTLQT